MGIIQNIKGKFITTLSKAAGKAADGIAEASQLSLKQIESIEKKKKEYYSQKPNPNSDESKILIEQCLGSLGVEVYHAYLSELNTIYDPIQTLPEKYDDNNRIAFFDITKWVFDLDENSLDKLVNVYNVLSKENCNLALIFHRTCVDCKITLGVVNNTEKAEATIVDSYTERLKDAIKGNFPGSVLSEIKKGIPTCLNSFNDKSVNIATVTNTATEKSEKFISQSIEKLLDGVIPQKVDQEYVFILLATPTLDYSSRQSRLSELYSALTPFSSWQTNFTCTTSDNENSSFSGGVNLGASAGASAVSGISDTLSRAVSQSIAMSQSHAVSQTHSSTNTKTIQGNVEVDIGPVKVGGGGSGSNSETDSFGQTDSYEFTNSSGQTQGNAKAESHHTGANSSINFGVNFNRASNVSISVGKNEGITQSFTNHQIKHTLDILDMQVKRLEQCSALGMWNFAAYVISDNFNTVNNVAHMYLALTQGEESFITNSAINIWSANSGNKETKVLLHEISHLQHPVFCLKENLDSDWLMYPATVDATTTISGRELAYAFNFPRKSVAGFPVLECAEFGRNIVTYDEHSEDDKKIELGNIFHMHHEEENNVVQLSLDSLASHTFITGSTGAGKSNTIYKMLDSAEKQDISFLVIEPAKGEYKHVFGDEDRNISVYGTNSKKMPLLRINPFSFPEDIHILEHLDRLVEIFNVCWPMYAAMPAVLKNAVEKAYEECGWDLADSSNRYGNDMYPTFADVARNVKSIIDASEYDSDNKGAYKGALLTRLQSLTNGINGMIFTVDELSDKDLFDKNVIVDISRIGSNETKSLIMGLLILKLQEYRMTGQAINSSLKHLTVLEEAHNILKRTSFEQPAESSNLLGKSVEMISNAIAEMRTYGEGFIIADQAPALLDMAVIRNTNTKIIMRLPDLSDRELVGRAANLNDNQIAELAKLPRGVAAVYQNEWIQPILCKVTKADVGDSLYSYEPMESNNTDMREGIHIAELLCNGIKLDKEVIMKEIVDSLRKMHITPSIRIRIINMLLDPPTEPRMTKLAPVMSSLFPDMRRAIEKAYTEDNNPVKWTDIAENELRRISEGRIDDQVRRDIIQAIITDYIYNQLGRIDDLEKWQIEGGLK